MKNKWFFLVVVVLLQLALVVTPAEAVVSVLSVSPNSVTNSEARVLTITGTDFVNASIVKLNGIITLATTFVSPTSLTAVLPQATQSGVYSVSVVNPDASTANLPNGLTVIDNISTATPTATATTAPTAETPPPTYARPVVVVTSYYTEPSPVQPGMNFKLVLTVTNQGQVTATNLLLNFSGVNFPPLDTGGVLTIGELKSGASRTVTQSFHAQQSLWGITLEPLEVKVSYTDAVNTAFSELFNTSISLVPLLYTAASVTPTATVQVNRPRLLVTLATTDIAILQPGSQFELLLEVSNVGSEDARNVNMVVGGATINPPSGTDTPGGSYTGSTGDFTNFSPLGSSNVQALGDIGFGAVFNASQALIVNVTTNPGAFTLKISFVYQNARGETLVDDQVITLLVKSMPMVDISFYREPGDLFTFQPNALPIQIVNIGKKSIILGNMKITAPNGFLENSTLQVGFLDPGGYLTLDAFLTPELAGELTITITVDYVDDFNLPQVISHELVMNVVEAPPMEIPDQSGINDPIYQPTVETFWQKVWRFIKGLLGLDSSPTQNQPDIIGPEEMPIEESTIKEEQGGIAVPVPRKGP